MPKFNIDVVVDSKGAEVGRKRVEQTFNQLENKADKLRRKVSGATNIDATSARVGSRQIGKQFTTLERRAGSLQSTFKSAFAFVGIAAGLRQLFLLADSFTSIQNRIRTVTESTVELTDRTADLFGIAQRTRASFTSTTELYVRLTNATRELSVSQQTMLGVTESINQAVILSGASAIEAQAGIIQLSQGLASGALQGDELRSVLEQLPTVADVIAKSMGATRGELRDLGSQGKITAEIVLGAFKEAREELAERFANSVTTLGQAFTVFNNSIINFIGNLDSGTGVTAALASIVVTLGNNLQNLFDITFVGISAFVAYKAALTAINLVGFVKQTVDYNKALSSGRVVALGSAEAERQKAVAIVASTKAGLAETRQIVATTVAERALVAARLANTQAVAAELLAERKGAAFSVATNTHRAANVAKLAELGQSTVLINKQVLKGERELATASAAVTSATAARTAALGSVATATANANKATAVQVGLMSRLSTLFPGVAAGLRGIGAALAANPVGAAIAVIVGALALLIKFSDRIEVKFGGAMVTLEDVGSATFTILGKRINDFARAAEPVFDRITTAVSKVTDVLNIDVGSITFESVILQIAKTIDTTFNSTIGLAITTVESMFKVFMKFPDLIAEFVIGGLNSSVGAVENFVNTTISGINRISSVAGLDPIELISFGEINNPFAGTGAKLGEELLNDIKANFNQGGLTTLVNEIIDEANFNRISDELSEELLELMGDSVNTSTAVDTLTGSIRILVGSMAEEAKLLGLTAREREISEGLRKQELKTKGGINALDKEVLGNMLEFIRARKEESEVLEQLLKPTETLNIEMATLSRLMTDGRISVETYNVATDKLINSVTGANDSLPALAQTILELNVLFPESARGTEKYASAVDGLLTNLFGLSTPMDAYKAKVSELELLQSSGTLVGDQYKNMLAGIQREALGIPNSAKLAADAITLLNEAKESGSISSQEYQTELRGIKLAQAELALSNNEGSFADGMMVAFDQITNGAESMQLSLTNAFASAGEALTSGFADAAAESIIQGESFREVWSNAAAAIGEQLLSAIIEIGIQQALNAAASTLFNTKETAEETVKTGVKLGGIGAVTAANLAAQTTTTAASVASSTVTTGAIVADNAVITASATPAAAAESAATFGGSAIAGLAALAAIVAFSKNAFADGGFVSGPGGPRSDSIPASLSNGEFVVNADSTSKYRPLLEGLNKKGGPKFADGGIVGGNEQPNTAPAANADQGNGPGNINLITVLDPKMVDDYLQTPAGDKTFVNLVERNKSAINSITRG